mgnify:CR=1 FL=1
MLTSGIIATDADVGSNSKAFAAFSATSINDSTTTRGTHALTKAVFISSFAITRLESTFQRGRPRNYIISLLAGFPDSETTPSDYTAQVNTEPYKIRMQIVFVKLDAVSVLAIGSFL